MTDFYGILCEKSNMPKDAANCALGFFENSDTGYLSDLFFNGGDEYYVTEKGLLCYKEAFFPYRFFDVLSKILKNKGVSNETGFLYAYILLAKEGFENHISRGLDENIYFDTMKRISDASREYFHSFGQYGIYDYHFLSNHLRGNVLRLGSFEYVYANYEDTPSIILHVPDGADFSREARLYSYSLARKYFGTERPIIADTWLLYGALSEMLPKDSNILSFAEDFESIHRGEESYEYSELFHVFGRLDDYSYENLPKNTSLQRAFAERVKNKLPVGSGVGILKY